MVDAAEWGGGGDCLTRGGGVVFDSGGRKSYPRGMVGAEISGI
ncbi:hypothetical protein [Pseudovibrio brasiliensis]|nr:hypothetical protein [Pseudovibrio brasiliensis]